MWTCCECICDALCSTRLRIGFCHRSKRYQRGAKHLSSDPLDGRPLHAQAMKGGAMPGMPGGFPQGGFPQGGFPPGQSPFGGMPPGQNPFPGDSPPFIIEDSSSGLSDGLSRFCRRLRTRYSVAHDMIWTGYEMFLLRAASFESPTFDDCIVLGAASYLWCATLSKARELDKPAPSGQLSAGGVVHNAAFGLA